MYANFSLSFTGAAGTSAHGTNNDFILLNTPSNDEFQAEEGTITKEQLEQDLRRTQASAYALGTLKNLTCQWRVYRHFSAEINVYKWPVSTHTLCLFAQYLAYTFHSARSVRNYLNGIRKMHILARMLAPDMKDIEVHITLMGLNKTMLSPVQQAKPFTPDILLDLVIYLDLSNRGDLVFWGVLVIGFFTFSCKSNLIPNSVDSFDSNKQLARSAVTFDDAIAVLSITMSKTIQYIQSC